MKQPRIRIDMLLLVTALPLCIVLFAGGCGPGGMEGYTNQWLYPENVSSVYVEMFDAGGFRRGHEYNFTDALCKRIESDTPYKIVSDRNLADTVLSGRVSIGQGVLATDRYEGTPLEVETYAKISVTWKNLKTGDILVDNEEVNAAASYSSKLGQDMDEASRVALNRAAEKVVELMETSW